MSPIRLNDVSGRVYKRLKRSYKRNINTLNLIKITLVAVMVMSYTLSLGNTQAQANSGDVVLVGSLTALTPEIVSVNSPKVNIQITQSQYQLDQAKQALAAKKAATVTVVASSIEPSAAEKQAWVKKAAGTFGIDWKVLAAVWQVESGQTWSTSRSSYAGAVGPCQFLPSTWRSYAYDGDGNGTASIYNASDCLFGAAKLLASNGASSGNVTQALLHYNHSMAYVNKVLGIANSYSG